MKILFLTSAEEDYLADSMLLGLRTLFGSDCVDYPRKDILYRDCAPEIRARVRGHGFTLYTDLLEELPVDRAQIESKVRRGHFDIVIISEIWRQFGMFVQWRPYLNRDNTIILDGADTPQVYPSAGLFWRMPSRWFLPRAHREFLYFKREWTADSHFNLWHRLFPQSWRSHLPPAVNLRRISFSIPEAKIVKTLPIKTKEFPGHIVDAEVAVHVPGSGTTYAFASEAEYYADLQASRFGITTKRAGWDCLRHYEIAANGCVPCFRDLEKKPDTCAPHGLVSGVNCLSYRNSSELLKMTNTISGAQYRELVGGALQWASKNTTVQRAHHVLVARQKQLLRSVV